MKALALVALMTGMRLFRGFAIALVIRMRRRSCDEASAARMEFEHGRRNGHRAAGCQ